MKKITLLIMFAFSAISFAQDSGTANVNVKIVEPINIENGTDLNFGSIIAAGGGNVRVAADGTRTFSNNDMKIITTTNPSSPALFKITAADGYSYSIAIPAITVSGPVGADPMTVSFTHEVDGETDSNATGTGAEQNLNVGGLIGVASGQPAGIYTGQVEVSVAYE
jgi:spore coat protein U-like protein